MKTIIRLKIERFIENEMGYFIATSDYNCRGAMLAPMLAPEDVAKSLLALEID